MSDQATTLREDAELREERDRYRAALVRISDAESGIWGRMAHQALHPEDVGRPAVADAKDRA